MRRIHARNCGRYTLNHLRQDLYYGILNRKLARKELGSDAITKLEAAAELFAELEEKLDVALQNLQEP
jgi:hypothetical protein